MEPKIWASADGIDYITLSKETFDGGMNVMRNSFFKDECVCIAVELSKSPGAAEELLSLCLKAALDGVSIVAVEKITGKVVGAAFNKLQIPAKPGEANYFENFAAACRFESSKALVQFMIDSDEACNIFDYYKVDCLLEIMFMATLPEYRKRGIGRKLIETSIEFARTLFSGENVKISIEDTKLPLEPIPKVVSLICTSFITQKICTQMGFSRTAEINYKNFIFKGKTFASRIGDSTPSTTLDSIKL